MAHDPSLGFADYFSAAADAMQAMEEGAPELFGLHADMELLGMRSLAAMPAGSSHSNKAAVLIDAGGADGSTNATVRFLSDGQHHQQAPRSLSLCQPDVGAGMTTTTLHQQHLGRHHQQQPAWMHEYAAGGVWHLRSSRFLLPTQQLLQEFCSLPVDATTTTNKRATTTEKPSSSQEHQQEVPDGSSSSTSWAPSPQIQAMDAMELQRLKDKLYIMLEEVDRRYRRYCDQMRSVAGGFEAVAGERAAAAYTALASRTISRQFRNLRDGVVAQLQAVRKALGEKDVGVPGMTRGETPRLRVLDQCIRQHKAALNQAGMMMDNHPWRPQRGLPERAVTILRAWLFEHFLHPYPSDVDKHILARQTGLSRNQVSNWFINARVRLWKPMVEEMYVEEMKDGHVNPNPSGGSQTSAEAYNGGRQHDDGVGEEADGGAGSNHNGGVERKPTREQLLHHDPGSLAAVVNVAGPGARRLENLGVMDQLGFDAYDGQAAGFVGGVSLTLGLQQHADSSSRDSGVNIAFGAPSSSAGYLFAAGHQQQMEGGGHHVQFGGGGAAMDGGAAHGQEHYRSLSAGGFHLLRDLAG